MKKNILALIMAVAMIFTMALPSFASSAANNIYFDSVPNGSVTANPTTATANQEVTLTVRPDTGYSFGGFLSGPETTPGSEPNTYKFTMPDYSVSFKPSFVADKYEIKGTFVDTNGKVKFSKTTDIAYNDDINITVEDVTSGYELSKLEYTVEGSQTPVSLLGKETFKMPASDINVVAEFAPIKYSVNLNFDSAYGNVTVENNKVAAGGTVRVLISPKDSVRYQIDKDALTVVASGSNTRPEFTWFDDASGNTAGITFTMPSTSVTVNVSFKRIQTDLRTITLDCERYGDADIYVNGSKITSSTIQARWDDVVTIDVDPDSKYMLESLVVTDADNGKVTVGYDDDMYSFVMPDKNVKVDIDFVSFGSKDKGPFDIYVDSDDGEYTLLVEGSESGLCLATDIAYQGDKIHLNITPDEGYVVESIDFGGASAYNFDEVDNYAWFKMPYDDVEITITYERDDEYEGDGDYEITTSYSSSKGKITVQDSADYGEKVYVTVKPKTGYVLDEIEVIKESNEKTVSLKKSSATKYYFTMPKDDVIIIATFVRGNSVDEDDDYYDIFVAESDHGEVDVDDEAVSGDTVKIKVESDYGYTVDEVVVYKENGKTVTVTKKSTYWQFTMPSSDAFIEVTYKKGSGSSSSSDGDYDIDLYYNDDYGYVDVVDSADASEKVYLYIEPEDDCEVDEIVITRTNGNTVSYKYSSSNDYYYFTMPASDVEIEVTFVGEIDDDDDEDDYDGSYAIILDYDDDAGIVEVDDEAEEGEKVYIELELEDEYTLDKIRVFEYATGATVAVRKSSATKYYFTMPADDVFVIVTFDSEEYEGDDEYYISVDSNDLDLGSADSSLSKAAKGERVLIFINSESEYAVTDVIAVRSNGHTITVDKINNFCYEFTMPASEVEVVVNFDEDRPLSYKEITLTYDKKMGEVYLSDEYAEEDDDINVYVEPKDGYEVASVSVKRTNGNKKVSCSKNKYGDYVFTMPDADVTVTVTFKKVEVEEKEDPKPTTPDPTLPSEPTVHLCPAQPYTDVDTTQWYHEAIDYVIAYNHMTGYSATQFAPYDNVSRAMVVTVLYRMAGEPAVTSPVPYVDVAATAWYADAVRWAYANGLLVNVASGNYFEPNSTITREQFASVVYRNQKLNGGGYTNGWKHPLNFTDLNLMSVWALEPLTWCNEFGIINGVGADRLDPQGSLNRAQLAQILLNLSKLDK